MNQTIISAENNYQQLDEYLCERKIRILLLVHDESFQFFPIKEYFDQLKSRLGIKVIRFKNFQSNPEYSSVVEGVDVFHKENCDSIIAVGGGSAIDVAKCIKLYSNMDRTINYLEQTIVPNNVGLLAIPTTAGTGSEATRYAVIYYKGEKQSVIDDSCIPDTVLMDGYMLKTLPEYQKKSTMLDSFCHAIESFWSVNSTEKSREYAGMAIRLIRENIDDYLANDESANKNMLMAAYLAGKAINITQTTAGHAMCYKITGLFGVAHGHAVALVDRKLWPWMIKNVDRCIDLRGVGYLKSIFDEIAEVMGCDDAETAADRFGDFFDSLGLEIPEASAENYEVLKNSVNLVRLKNNPVFLDVDTIDMLYHEILRPLRR